MNTAENTRLKDSFISFIQDKVLSGELKPGDRLPPERELAAQFNMSRSSINQGILDLERAGFLRIVPRKGTFIADILDHGSALTLIAIMNSDSSAYHGELLLNLLDTRILIERECARLACKHMNQERAKELWLYTDKLFEAEQAAIAEAMFEYHLYIVKLSGNTVYKMIFQSFQKTIKNLMQLHYQNESERKSNLPLYEGLTRSICACDENEAQQQMELILQKASEYLMHEAQSRD